MYCVPYINRLNYVYIISQTLQNKLVVLVSVWLLLVTVVTTTQLCDYQ